MGELERRSEQPRSRSGGPIRGWPRDEVSGHALDPGQSLIWRPAGLFLPGFQLRQGRVVVGEMEPVTVPRSEMHATGECLGRILELRRQSSLLRGVRVETRASLEGHPGPRYEGRYLGWEFGRVVTAPGEVLRWRRRWLSGHALFDSTGEELLRLRPVLLTVGGARIRVTVRPRGWWRPDLGELLLLTWFLRLHAEGRGRKLFGGSRRRSTHDAP